MAITLPYSYGYKLVNHKATAYETRIKRHRTKYFYPYQDCKDKFYCLEPFLLTIQSFKYMVINGNKHDSNLVYIYKLGFIKTHKTPRTERDIKPDTLVTSEFIMYNSN